MPWMPAINANDGRDFSVERYLDVRMVSEDDPCARCGKPLRIVRGIEVGHVFKLGTKYSEAMDATYLDADGTAHPVVMGCYGIGVGRTAAAASSSITMPMASSGPYQTPHSGHGRAGQRHRQP